MFKKVPRKSTKEVFEKIIELYNNTLAELELKKIPASPGMKRKSMNDEILKPNNKSSFSSRRSVLMKPPNIVISQNLNNIYNEDYSSPPTSKN